MVLSQKVKLKLAKKGISDEMKLDQIEKQGGKFEPIIGPIKPTDDESGADKQLPLSERVEVIRVQSWTLDKSGNKTNEKIKDDNTKIKGINQPPSDINPK